MLSIICEAEFHEADSFSKSKSYANLRANKHVENVHSSSFFKELINKLNTDSLEADELKEQVKSLISNHVESNKDNEAERNDIISLAISCLQCFVQANWLGPLPEQTSNLPLHLQNNDPNDLSKKMFFLKDFLNNIEYETFQEKLRLFMSSNGEYVIPSVKCIHFLVLARFILIDFVDQFQAVPLINWWSLRTIYLYQQLFEELPETLSTKSLQLIDTLVPYFQTESARPDFLAQYDKEVLRFASIILYLEVSNSYYQNYNWTKAQEFYDRALSESAVTFQMMGVLGKRTKFQSKDVAQLLLKVEDAKKIPNNFQQWPHFNRGATMASMPKDLSLNDDTLLDKIKIANQEEEQILESGKSLSQLEHIVLYGILHDYQKNSAKTELTHEELTPFIDYLLRNSPNWCVHVVSMFMRTNLEATSNRRMERSLMQLETLIENFYTKSTERAEAADRLQFFYSIPFPAIWVLNKKMAQYYMKLGLINSALEIYLKLQMWSEVIDCYQALDKRDQAEELIRERLAIKETPELYCSLGEVTMDIQYFHKAIEMSKGKSAKGYRMLAKHQFAREQYVESIENFEKSLQINGMQYNTWFMLGSAGFRSDKWSTAVKAFRQCTYLEPESHEVWNNLAASYIKMNEKNKAHGVFIEALKYAYDNGKIWENFLWTSTDCCYFEDVVRAYNRLLDIKEKYVDTDVLNALKTSVVKKLKDPNGVSVYQYKKSILKLFGRLTSLVLNNWKIFWYYGEIVLNFGMIDEKTLEPIELSSETADKALGYFYKSFKILYNQPNWDISAESCSEILSVSTELLINCITYGKGSPFMKDMSGSLSLTVKSLMTKLKSKYSVDKNNNEDSKYEKLLYLADANESFVHLQQEYERFRAEFFAN